MRVIGALVGLVGHVAAGVGDHVDLESLLDRREHGADDAHRGPQAGDDEARLAELVDAGDDVGVLPAVHRGAIDEVELRLGGADLGEDRAREGLFGHGGEDRGDAEDAGRAGHQGGVVAQQDAVDRAGGERHLRLVVDEDQGVIAGVSSDLAGAAVAVGMGCGVLFGEDETNERTVTVRA